MASSPAGPTTGRWPLVLAALVPLLLGTVVVVGAGFGILTGCTDAFGCATTGCAPCRPASNWLNAGWAVQGILLLAALVLAVVARRAGRPRTIRVTGLTIAGLSVAVAAVTTTLAASSY